MRGSPPAFQQPGLGQGGVDRLPDQIVAPGNQHGVGARDHDAGLGA